MDKYEDEDIIAENHKQYFNNGGKNVTDIKTLDLENFADGVAKEFFQREMQSVLNNIDDRNTAAESVRSITLKFTIKPNLKRTSAELYVDARCSLAPVQRAGGIGFFGRRAGKLQAFHRNIDQMELDTTEKPQLVDKPQAINEGVK